MKTTHTSKMLRTHPFDSKSALSASDAAPAIVSFYTYTFSIGLSCRYTYTKYLLNSRTTDELVLPTTKTTPVLKNQVNIPPYDDNFMMIDPDLDPDRGHPADLFSHDH